MRSVSSRVLLFVSMVLIATLGFSQIVKQQQNYLDDVKFKDDNLGVKTQPVYLANALPLLTNKTSWQTFAQKNVTVEAYLDRNTGMPLLVNGSGIPWVVGNPFLSSQFHSMAAKAFQYIRDNEGIFQNLPIEYLQLNLDRSGPLGEDGYLWFVDFDFVYQGVPIDGARVVFRCNHGNMVQFGVEGIIPFAGIGGVQQKLDPVPALSAARALEIAYGYSGGMQGEADTVINPGVLKFVPSLIGSAADFGPRYRYPLVWEVAFHRDGVVGTWTAWVDAHTGQVLSFWDSNDYGVVKGGVLPVGPTVGSEVSRGLPFANVATSTYANWAGRYDSPTSGAVTSTLAGKYVKIADSCHAISLAGTAPADLDFGTSTATDCSYGNGYSTRAGRSCFYHVGNVKYKASMWLPSNTWLTGQITANMNLNQTCNAYWNGSTINFFRSGGGCGNTGEIAAIFLHEFGHGLDSNDGGPSSDNGTGETYGDTLGMLQTHNSCGGPGFFSSNCSGYGDACTSCTGVRELDYAKHSSGSPHTIQNMSGTFSCPSSSSYRGPCGKEGHCESYPLSEAMWDLANRDLPSYNSLDVASAWFVLDRLFFLSRSTSGSGYTCSTAASSGCGASYWFQTFLTVDDDNGNLSDGTPHSAAIYAAFNRHGVACSTYNKPNSTTCPSLPTPSPLNATAGANTVALSWPTITNAAKYFILRNDLGCDNGFTKIAETTSTSYNDNDVANGMTYYYRMVAVGSTAACYSPLAGCKTATPGGTTVYYSISGTVSGATASGVTMTLSGAASGTTATAADGTYTFGNLSNGAYTVTPSKSGFSFSPASTAVTISGANQTGKNFTATAVATYSISGAVSGAVTGGVTMTLSGAASATTTSAPSTGTYTFSGLANGSYTVTPSLSGYTFSPTSTAVTISGANQTGKNFTATASPNLTATFNTTYQAPACTTNAVSCDTGSALVHCMGASGETNQPNTINDSCADGTSGTCSSDESVEQLSIATTDSSYLAVGKSVTVTAKFYCYSATADYVAAYYASTVPASGVPTWTSLGTSTCGATGLVTKTYTTTLYGSAGMQAVRAEIAYNAAITSACQSGNYNDRDDLAFNVIAGTTTTYSISGTVSGAVASGVTMTLSGAASATTTTASGGTYTFSNLANGTYTVTPSLSGYTFSPTSTSVTISGANQTGKNFTSTAATTYSISGTVSGAVASGVTMTLSGAASATTTTASGGTYAFSGLSNGTYTVTPSLSGYTFSPASTSVTIASANQTGKNFTSATSGGSTTLFSEDFSSITAPALPSGWTTLVTSGNAWTTNTSGCTGSALRYPYNSTAAANSWAFTPGIALTSGVTYTLTFNQKVQSATWPEGLEVKAGTAATAAGQTITLWSQAGLTNTACTARSATFTVPSSGTYYLGWHCISAADMYYLFVDDILLTSGGGAPTTYSISGTVSGAVASGVTVSTGSASATTNSSGAYTISGLANGTYTVTPSLSGYTFSPTSLSVTISGANQTGKNFTSTASGGGTTLFTDGLDATTGWAQVDTSGTAGTWSLVASGTYPTCSTHGGTNMGKFNSYNASSGSATRYYRTAGFSTSAYTTITLTFWMYHDTGYSTNADKIQVQVSNAGGAWTSVGSAINRYDGSTGWKQHTISLSSYKYADLRLGFLATSAYGNNIFIDDVTVIAQ